MSISTYSELKAAIATKVRRSDLTSDIVDAITFAEAKFNRRLRVRQMEAALASTSIASNVITRPVDCLAVRMLWNTDTYKTIVDPSTLEAVVQSTNTGTTAHAYAWDRTYFRFDVETGEVAGVYYESIDALSDSNTTNWLLTLAPDIYVAATLAELYADIPGEEQQMTLWESKANARIDELNRNDQRDRFSGNGLQVRAR